MLRDRRFQLAALAAAGAGAVVFLRHRGGAAAAGGGGVAGLGTSGGAVGQLDTTGTDLASMLGDYSQGLNTQLDNWDKQLTSTLDQLAKATPGTKPAPAPVPAPKPAPAPKQPTRAPEYVTVTRWTAHDAAWNSTLSGIAKHYGTTVGSLARLNSIRNPNLIHVGQRIRVK